MTRLVLAEPDRFMRAKLAAKVEARSAPFPIEIADAGVDPIPFADGSFDVVVSTLVLCSVPDHEAALAEIHRVLRPGGRFVFLEHIAAVENPKRHRWQRRIEPLWKRLRRQLPPDPHHRPGHPRGRLRAGRGPPGVHRQDAALGPGQHPRPRRQTRLNDAGRANSRRCDLLCAP